ncbi:hypothetical protein [Streptomyces xanthophaeus]|uniref:Uncharacterized protein n=1 Tax=Streptomyces xanthophaeus TaxID=67385 RepID=A0A919GTT1_9ACTN|nr:hypothetical protein [Streptomyces xanthophaeus]WCD84640.1 hypothetical protein KPP03845_100963 [Streptomyces xanthophaeus]WST20872.1 hypothetical protein OG264_04760 [Streptomyces xanthophaeus]WST64142.1 hypothetical protein OG605_33600 [Streptomyces xanthophaeus]GHI83609.1 hypothetical protein Sxan_09730 [Streptomyces xanthophaeus]
MNRKRTAAVVSVLLAFAVTVLGAGAQAHAAAGEKKVEVIK